MNNKFILTMLLILTFFLLIGGNSAIDIDDIDVNLTSSDTDVILQTDNTDLDVLTADEGSFSELNTIISNSKSEINLTKNYVFNQNSDSDFIDGIVINKTISINGNGYTINGKNTAHIFNIPANNISW